MDHIDADGFGSIIIDPSDVEKKLRTQSKTSANFHQLIFYKNGLESVKKALSSGGALIASEKISTSGTASVTTKMMRTKMYYY